MKAIILAMSLGAFLLPASVMAETTTTTTTHADGSKTVVEETTTPPEQTQVTSPSHGKIIGPTGATGTIRRSGRRQGRRGDDVHIQN